MLVTQSGPTIATIVDLLTALCGRIRRNLLSDFRTTANHLARYFNVPVEHLSLDSLLDPGQGFKADLEARRYKRGSVIAYVKFASMMLRHARSLGWTPREPEVPECWKEILEAVTKAGCKDIVRYAIRQKIAPSEFTNQHLDAWVDSMVARGRTYTTALQLKAIFKRILKHRGLARQCPLLSPLKPTARYGIPLKLFPERLRVEVEKLLAWKQAEFAPKRPHKCRHRAVTAEGLKAAIEQLYGFATNIEPKALGPTSPKICPTFASLTEFVTQETVTSWVEWLINTRKVLNETARLQVGMLYAAVRYYPDFVGRDFSWFSELTRQIPPDPHSGIEERKLRKYVEYDILADIPRQIQDARQRLVDGPAKKLALLVRDELLIRWLTILPWRQRNIRECRVGINLFKRKLPAMGSVEIPEWVKERLRANPSETFWQFDFLEHETKNGERVRAILPRQLVAPLEEYLDHYRPLLVNGSDPGTLFVSAIGCALDSIGVRDLVSDITYRYTKTRVTPHLFRDAFAYRWLKDRPTDYLTLSKHLWHKDLNTTLHCYGSKFDTSHAACEVGEWLDKRVGGA
jgi:integrase